MRIFDPFKDMITSSEKIFGRYIDIVVNNAGIQEKLKD